MRSPNALWVALALLSVTLAGCSSGGDESGSHGFKITSTPSDPITEPYVFKATVSGDSFSWDLGDGRTAEGEEVSHVYGISSGTVKPKLTVTTAGERETYPARTIIIGSGANTAPSLEMTISQNWVTVGESMTFSGATSTDPDGDPLLFSWFCVRQSDIGPVGAGHAHGGGGIQYGATGPDPVPARVLNGTEAPAVDQDLGEDVCTAMQSQSAFTEDATVSGSFTQNGIYKITMLGKDPTSPSVPGSILVYVTDADEPRIDAPVVIPFSGSFQNGVPAALDGAMQQLENSDHIQDVPFSIEYPILGFELDFNYDAGVANEVTYHLLKPNGQSKFNGEQDTDLSEGKDFLDKGGHILRVYGRQGADLSFDGSITITYQNDPSLLFESPEGH